jgi:hypothetical protein
MCLRRAPEKYIVGAKAAAGAALDRAALESTRQFLLKCEIIKDTSYVDQLEYLLSS